MYIYICIWIYMYIHIRVYMFLHTCISINIYVCTHAYITIILVVTQMHFRQYVVYVLSVLSVTRVRVGVRMSSIIYAHVSILICKFTHTHTHRAQIRNATFTGQTSGAAPGFVQCNFVALPKEYAFDFMTFCLRNPKPCPLIEGARQIQARTYAQKQTHIRTCTCTQKHTHTLTLTWLVVDVTLRTDAQPDVLDIYRGQFVCVCACVSEGVCDLCVCICMYVFVCACVCTCVCVCQTVQVQLRNAKEQWQKEPCKNSSIFQKSPSYLGNLIIVFSECGSATRKSSGKKSPTKIGIFFQKRPSYSGNLIIVFSECGSAARKSSGQKGPAKIGLFFKRDLAF